MDQIKMMTCLGENTVSIFQEIAQELTNRLNVEFIFDPKPESTPAAEKLVCGDVQMGWICGLLYIEKVDSHDAQFDLLAAPIFSGYDRPDYSSFLIVPADSPAESLVDLEGKRLTINEPTSWSGNHLLRSMLYEKGLTAEFFGDIIVSGAHSQSMRLVAERKADCATIDHGVFEFVAENQPELMAGIKVIGQIGPSPAPPFVIHRSVSNQLKDEIKTVMLELGQDEHFQAKIRPHRMETIVPIQDSDYNPIRAGFANSLAMN